MGTKCQIIYLIGRKKMIREVDERHINDEEDMRNIELNGLLAIQTGQVSEIANKRKQRATQELLEENWRTVSSSRLEELYVSGADINACYKNGKTVLMNAIMFGNAEATKWLIEKEADINMKDKHGSTALMYAAFFENEQAVDLLMSRGVDINARDENGEDAIIYAKGRNNKTIVKKLEKYKGEVQEEKKNKNVRESIKEPKKVYKAQNRMVYEKVVKQSRTKQRNK